MRIAFVVLFALILAPATGSARGERLRSAPIRAIELASVHAVPASKPSARLRPQTFRLAAGVRGWVVRVPRKYAQQQAPRPTTPGEFVRAPSNVPSPAVWRGRVIVGGPFHERALHAFDGLTGRHLWTRELADNGPSALAITDRYGFTNTESCTTYAITPRTGKVAWSRHLGPTVLAAPAVMGERLYAAHRIGEHEQGITAMDAATGAVIWQRAMTHDLIGAPVCAGDRIFMTLQGGMLACMDDEGRTLWTARGTACSAPFIRDNRLFVAEEAVWRLGPPVVRCVNAETGRTIWRTDPHVPKDREDVNAPRWPSHNGVTQALSGWASDAPRPYLKGKHCWVAGGRDLLMLDADAGALKRRLRLPAGRRFHSPPVDLGTTFLFVTYEGLLLEIEPRTGNVVYAVDLAGRATSQPVVEDGWAYVAIDDLLYGVALRKGVRKASWPQWGGTPSRAAAEATRTGR